MCLQLITFLCLLLKPRLVSSSLIYSVSASLVIFLLVSRSSMVGKDLVWSWIVLISLVLSTITKSYIDIRYRAWMFNPCPFPQEVVSVTILYYYICVLTSSGQWGCVRMYTQSERSISNIVPVCHVIIILLVCTVQCQLQIQTITHWKAWVTMGNNELTPLWKVSITRVMESAGVYGE